MRLHKLFAFLWRDWVEARSYRLSFFLQSAALVLPLAMLFFMGRMFRDLDIPAIDRYGGNYVAFALIGIVITTYSGTALRAFSAGIKRSQATGTLETLFLTRTGLYTMIFGWSLYPLLRASLNMLVYLGGGFLVLGLRLGNANFAGILVTLALTLTIMMSLGILAAGFTILFKQGDPFTRLIVLASALLSGTVYPTSVLPDWLQVVANLLPQTYAIEAMRLFVLKGHSLVEAGPELAVLALFAVLLMPLSLVAFRVAVYRARVEGSLAHY